MIYTVMRTVITTEWFLVDEDSPETIEAKLDMGALFLGSTPGYIRDPDLVQHKIFKGSSLVDDQKKGEEGGT